jgi:ABC-type phosphate transport system substrate-binding protein
LNGNAHPTTSRHRYKSGRASRHLPPNTEVATAVKAFLTVALDQGQKDLADSGYSPIPDSLKSKLKVAVDAIT